MAIKMYELLQNGKRISLSGNYSTALKEKNKLEAIGKKGLEINEVEINS